MTAPRIILADPHMLLADAIKRILEPEFDIVAICSNSLELLKRAPVLNPDLIILETALPGLDGLIVGERLKQALPKVKLFYLTTEMDQVVAGKVFRLGASGYVLKISNTSELVHAIRQVLHGGSYAPKVTTENVAGSFVQSERARSTPELTLRQKEVLQLLAGGRTMKEVAFALHLSPRTVAFHKYTMMKTFSLRSTAELIRFALTSSSVAT